MLVLLIASPTWAALTVDNRTWVSLDNKKMLLADVDFDSSYPFGGEAFDYTQQGFVRADSVKIFSESGMIFEYDYANKKIKAFTDAPPVIYEESVTVTANVGTLKYPAAYVMYVSTGNATYRAIPGGLTPVTGTVSVSEPVWGTRPTLTFLAGDSVTSCKVTYVTQAWKEVFDNYVLATLTAGARVTGHADLAFAAGTPDEVQLGEIAVAIQGIMWSDNATYKPMKALYKAETAATTEATIDFTDTGETTLNVLQTDTIDAATDSLYIQYIRQPTSGFLVDRFIEEDDLTPSSDVITSSSGLSSGSNMLIYGTSSGFAGPTTIYTDLISSTEAVGTTATLIQPTTVNDAANTFTFGSNHADSDHVKPSYIAGYPYEIPGLVPLEVPDGFNLSDITNVRVEIIGH